MEEGEEGGLVMKGFGSEEEDVIMDPLWAAEPVEVLENRREVTTGAGERTSSGALDVYLGFWMEIILLSILEAMKTKIRE